MAADDTETIRAMYDDHARGVFAYLARRVGRDLAEDLLAETYRIALETYPRFDHERGTERMWLFGIATNLLRRHWRTEQRRLLAIERSARSAEHIDPLITVADGVATRVDAASDVVRLLDALTRLQPEDRDLLFLSGWERLNSTEIGQVLGVPAATVRSRLHRLRSDLRVAVESRSTHPTTSEGTP